MIQANVKTQLKELDKLIDASEKFDKKKVDLEGAPSALSVTPSGKLTFDQVTNFMGQTALDRTSGLSIKALAQRHGCTNSIIIGHQDAIQLRHLGETQVLLGRLQQSFADILPIGADILNRIYAVTNKALPNLAEVLVGLSKQYNWDDDAQSQILIGTEGQETVMGLVNGVSFAASKIEDSASRVEMETQAGTILVAPDSLFARAAQQVSIARR